MTQYHRVADITRVEDIMSPCYYCSLRPKLPTGSNLTQLTERHAILVRCVLLFINILGYAISPH